MAAVIIDGPEINRIFFPYMEQRTREVLAAGGRFVYYTTADTAVALLKGRQVWMRSTTAMNDYMEVDHGFECLKAAYHDEPGKAFNGALDASFPGLANEVRDLFDGWLPQIRYDTYITCVSEHMPAEDRHGRLDPPFPLFMKSRMLGAKHGKPQHIEREVLHGVAIDRPDIGCGRRYPVSDRSEIGSELSRSSVRHWA